MIEIQAVNGFASVQDLGRFGLKQYGIGHNGAMDRLALKTGNILLKNEQNSAAIELFGGITLQFKQDTPFVITGALYEGFLDDKPIHSHWRYTARQGQILKLVKASVGTFGYLCVAGGIDTPIVLGSRSTEIKAGFGGFQGRLLQAGDRLAIGRGATEMKVVGIAPPGFGHRIRAVCSSEYFALTRLAQSQFWRTRWVLSSNSNRMGYRLEGQSLALQKPLEMRSHGVQFGTIQLPPQGLPIILMADSQTTGGYPKIAKVIDADLGFLAQIRAGEKLQFDAVSPMEALQATQQQNKYLYQITRIADEN